jgi:hypothetical protein
MKTHHVLMTTAGILLAGMAAVASQNPPPQSATPRPAPAAQAAATGATTTMVGCLYRERDVPGRTPNVVEKAGVLEDYILADARMAGPGATSGAQGVATGRMYKLESLRDEQLKAFVGKRVEVTGRIDADAGERPTGQPTRDRNPISPDAVNLPDFDATAIKEVAGGAPCPATPAAAPAVPNR